MTPPTSPATPPGPHRLHRRGGGRRPGRWTAAALAVPALAGLAGGLAGCGGRPVTQQLAQVVAEAPPADPSARAGGLVDGFPAMVPVPTGARVTASAVQSRGDLLAVSVTGTSPLAPPALLAWFRTRLLAEGFTATDDSLLPRGASGAAFGRPGGRELLIVAVVDRGTERSWSVGGTVAPVLHGRG